MKNARRTLTLALATIIFHPSCRPADTSQDSGPGPDAPDRRSPLGAICTSGSDCASGFCADGACCDSTCDDQCYGCAQQGSRGRCTPIVRAEDPSAATACTGSSYCVLDPTGIPVCKVRDKEPCSTAEECASGFCRTYFVDADGDGYGLASSYQTICDSAAAPAPHGYAAMAGDCCDTDNRANPAATSYLVTPDACGSFDWNCNGIVERQTDALCPGPSAKQVACGITCYTTLLGSTSKVFTQQCR